MSGTAQLISRFFNQKRFNLIACAIIAALILIAYSNTFTASFHFDDNPTIIENPTIRHITGENILKILSGNRPVVYFSIMLNYFLGGLNVVGYHVFNIGVHITNSIFVYLLVLWTLTLPSLGERYRDSANRIALFTALLFGVHPVQTESVTYIISRTELLATVFYLATFLLFVRGGRSGKFSYAIGMLVTSTLAMASKEWAVTLPAMLFLYDLLFFSGGKIRPVLSRWHIYLLTALPWIFVLSTLDLFSTGGRAGVGFNLVSATGITTKTYFYTSMNVIWTYIRLLIMPVNQNLDYDYAVARTLFEFPTILSFFGHIAVVVSAYLLYKKRHWTLVPFGIAWFYIGLSPTQSIVPVVDLIFEHRVYMPSIGFFLVFVLLYESAFDWLAEKRGAKAAVTAG